MEKINSTAIIAARKDSKGIKDKNLQKIGNTPLVEISILQATRTCKNVLVTTDSPEIISLAKKYKDVFVVNRNKQLAKDDSPKLPVLQNAITVAESEGLVCNDFIFDLQPTSPFRRDDSILKSYELLKKYDKSSNLVSVSPTSYHPSYNLLAFKEENGVELLHKTSEPITGRNMLPSTYKMDGCIFLWKKQILMNNFDNRIILSNTIGYKVSKIESLDIDTPEDLDYARYISKKLFE